jgi:anaerobic dimethyl sulfoxide reductase subunit B (iron-sulfur subunit)
MTQYGFFFDQSRCTNCHACTVACRDWNDIKPGPVKWIRVFRWETGTFPLVRLNVLALPCLHCAKPVCLEACPHEAMYKEDKYGVVLIDYEKCGAAREKEDCRKCWDACPYGVPQFSQDGAGGTATMCTMCIDRLEQGMYPVCAEACRARALDFGKMEELQVKYGSIRTLEGMPECTITNPSIALKPHDERKELVSYPVEKALELLAERGDLPRIYDSKEDVTEVKGIVTTNELHLKTKNVEEALYWTKADEG